MVLLLLPKTTLILLLLTMLTIRITSEDVFRCQDLRCNSTKGEVCVATLDVGGSSINEECQAHPRYFNTCQALSCASGSTCQVRRDPDGGDADLIGCVSLTQGHNTAVVADRVVAAAATKSKLTRREQVNSDPKVGDQENDPSVAWCIVIAVLSLLPLIVLACIVIYRFVYKLPRLGREKEELTRLFQTLGYDENTEIYKKVIEFFYK